MRPTIAATALLIVLPAAPAAGQAASATADSMAIHDVLEVYVSGWREGDARKLATVIASAGSVLWPGADGLSSMTWGDVLAKRRPRPAFGLGWRLEELDIVDGTIATARLWIPDASTVSVDILALYKLDGRWTIVSKTFVTRRRVP